jgi:hypothetical protein
MRERVDGVQFKWGGGYVGREGKRERKERRGRHGYLLLMSSGYNSLVSRP